MFLNIFSVTLSEDFIAYFLLHFTYPLRQVHRTKPCILACRIPRSFCDTKRIFPLPFFSFRRPSKPKKRKKSSCFRAFSRTRKRQADVLPSCEPRGKNCRTTATKSFRQPPERYNGNRFSISKSSPRFFAFPNFCIHSRHSVYATCSPYWNCVSSSSLNSNNSSILAISLSVICCKASSSFILVFLSCHPSRASSLSSRADNWLFRFFKSDLPQFPFRLIFVISVLMRNHRFSLCPGTFSVVFQRRLLAFVKRLSCFVICQNKMFSFIFFFIFSFLL